MLFFFLIEDREVFKADRNKLFASNEKQTDNHTSMLDMLLSIMSVMCIYYWSGVFLVLTPIALALNQHLPESFK